MKTFEKKTIKLDLTEKEAEYLSSLVEAQVSRLSILKQKDLAKKPFKEEYKVFNKLGEMLKEALSLLTKLEEIGSNLAD